jgi:subtilisin family serine protease
MDGADAGVTAVEAFPGRTGRGVRVAVIDSGVHVLHPHINRVSGGVTIGEQVVENSYVDVLGHGTAVTAAIQEKAPDAEYFVVRVFHSALRTNIVFLLRAIEWCIDHNIDVVNLSLGTSNPAHAERFVPLISRAAEHGMILVSARDANGIPALPGRLPGVIGVGLNWDWPRGSYSYKQTSSGLELYASGYPRPAPGIPQERNLNGVSFAVANMTGFVVRSCEGLESCSYQTVCSALAAEAHRLAITLDTGL